MTREEIVERMGWLRSADNVMSDIIVRIEKIVNAAIAAEREACAKLCLEEAPSLDGQLCADAIRDAIRARGGE